MDKYPEDEMLFLERRKLEEIPEIPPHIKAVNLNHNKLKSVVIPHGNEIKYLDVSDNLIRDIASTSTLTKIEVLDCSYNLIRKIPLLCFREIKELYLIANDIEKIENLNFETLEKLDLASNSIRRIENINCKNLRELYLGNNEISRIGDLRYLKHLVILDLQYNRLEELDCAMLPENLEILLVKGNKSLKNIINKDKLKHLKSIF